MCFFVFSELMFLTSPWWRWLWTMSAPTSFGATPTTSTAAMSTTRTSLLSLKSRFEKRFVMSSGELLIVLLIGSIDWNQARVKIKHLYAPLEPKLFEWSTVRVRNVITCNLVLIGHSFKPYPIFCWTQLALSSLIRSPFYKSVVHAASQPS